MAKGTIVVSLRSKGLPSFNRNSFFDIRHQASVFATELFDIFTSLFVTFSCLSWSAYISIVIAICTMAGTMTTDFAQAPLELVFPFFMYTILPLLILFTLTFRRRERALTHLAKLKSLIVAICIARPDADTSGPKAETDEVKTRVYTLLDDLHKYLQHKRPYARHFFAPYRAVDPSPTDLLYKLSRELGILLRKVHRDVRDLHLAVQRLHDTGLPDAQIQALSRLVMEAHTSIEELSNIKEMRTPMLLRATIRWFTVVLMPVSLGPYWNYVRTYMRNSSLSGILGVLTQVALMSVLDTTVALEDPFDDSALDTISLVEMLDHVNAMTGETEPSDNGPDVRSGAYTLNQHLATAAHQDQNARRSQTQDDATTGGPSVSVYVPPSERGSVQMPPMPALNGGHNLYAGG